MFFHISRRLWKMIGLTQHHSESPLNTFNEISEIIFLKLQNDFNADTVKSEDFPRNKHAT